MPELVPMPKVKMATKMRTVPGEKCFLVVGKKCFEGSIVARFTEPGGAHYEVFRRYLKRGRKAE
jgi:hypothetical protein